MLPALSLVFRTGNDICNENEGVIDERTRIWMDSKQLISPLCTATARQEKQAKQRESEYVSKPQTIRENGLDSASYGL